MGIFSWLLWLILVGAGGVASAATDASSSERIRMGAAHIVASMLKARAQRTQDDVLCAESNGALSKDLDLEAVARAFNCKTIIGTQLLRALLAKPLGASEAAQALRDERVRCIQAIIDNPELMRRLDELLGQAQRLEPEVIALAGDQAHALEKQKHRLSFYDRLSQSTVVAKFAWLMQFGSFIDLFVQKDAVLRMVSGKVVAKEDARLLTTLSMFLVCQMTTFFDYYRQRKALKPVVEWLDFLSVVNTVAGRQGAPLYHAGIDPSQENIRKVLPGFQRVMMYTACHYGAYDVLGVLAMPLDFASRAVTAHLDYGDLFGLIAELDMYNACAKKIIESQSKSQPNGFCFAQVVASSQPQVCSKALWNVGIPQDAAVANDITLQSQSMLLTGANAGGKTSMVKGLLQNILLAQSLGIAAAQSFAYTPYDVIHSYLHIADDLKAGTSLFQAEVKSAQSIVQASREIRTTGKKFFFVLDELFSSTGARAGEQCAYRFMKNILKNPGLQCIYSTHFDAVKRLEHEGVSAVNYSMAAPTKDGQGNFIYPYRLVRGENTLNIALELAELAHLFDDDAQADEEGQKKTDTSRTSVDNS